MTLLYKRVQQNVNVQNSIY